MEAKDNRNPLYIGDSVYVSQDEYDRLVLTTENGFGASNTIIFEPFVIEGLLSYINKHYITDRTKERIV